MRASVWRLKTCSLELPAVPRVMGIVNVTPDSFSDGGQFASTEAAVERALQLVADGADLLDIGGESTRPYATEVDAREELRRVLPVIEKLRDKTTVPLSIDTSKALVARECLAAGAEIINDVTGLEGDPDMLAVALESRAGVCAMHMQGNPQTMQDQPQYVDVVRDISKYLLARRDALRRASLEPERICLDPGIGFGKTHQHNLTLLAGCQSFHSLGCPLLVGPSRKGFIAKVLGQPQADRDAGTVGVCLSLAQQGVQILRVHNVALLKPALLLFAASGGVSGQALQLAPAESPQRR
ncbi:MAG: dihydropteroate synthase [Pirellulales bacterium]